MKRIKEQFILYFVTVAAIVLLFGMSATPFLFHEQACGTMLFWQCFSSSIGAAGSAVSGIGVFLLIFDLRQRAKADANASAERQRSFERARLAALKASSVMTTAFVPDIAVLQTTDDPYKAARAIDVFKSDQRHRFQNEIAAIRTYARVGNHALGEIMNRVETLLTDMHEFAHTNPAISENGAPFRRFVANCNALKKAMAEIPDQILK